METVAESQDKQLAEDLMRFIMEMEDKELFAAMLYTCYELIQPDVALEIAWRSDLMEFAMPFFIQFVNTWDQELRLLLRRLTTSKREKKKPRKSKWSNQST